MKGGPEGERSRSVCYNALLYAAESLDSLPELFFKDLEARASPDSPTGDRPGNSEQIACPVMKLGDQHPLADLQFDQIMHIGDG